MTDALGNSYSKSIFISAGEPSGDLHASVLIKELRIIFPSNEMTVTGLGGDRMRKENADLLYHINDLSAIGFVDVIRKYNFFRKVLKNCLKFVRNNNVNAVILVDYPGFNLRFAEELRKFYTGKIIYYISPQLWAWNEKRVYAVKKNVDKMLVVFPFEVDFYKKFGVDSVYVGHPLVKRIGEFLENNFRDKKIFGSEKKLAILPGSRKTEIKNHLPVLLKTADQLCREFELTVNISKAAGVDNGAFDAFSSELRNYNLTSESVYELILNSDLVFTKSGTSTVECALIGTPFLIFYKTFLLNYYLLKPMVKVDRLGMINILAKEMIVKEFIQKEFTSGNLLLESRRILTDENYKSRMQQKLRKVWEILGTEDASLNAAKIISSYI
jgi:lipid-A-disaccharide synthase